MVFSVPAARRAFSCAGTKKPIWRGERVHKPSTLAGRARWPVNLRKIIIADVSLHHGRSRLIIVTVVAEVCEVFKKTVVLANDREGFLAVLNQQVQPADDLLGVKLRKAVPA